MPLIFFVLNHEPKARYCARHSSHLCLPSQHREGQISWWSELFIGPRRRRPPSCSRSLERWCQHGRYADPQGRQVFTFDAKQQKLYLKHYIYFPIGSVSWQDKIFEKDQSLTLLLKVRKLSDEDTSASV